MNLLYIALGNGLNPGIGGSLTRSIEIARALADRGHKITFAVTSGSHKACLNRALKANYLIVPAWFGKSPETECGKLDRLISNLASTLLFSQPFNPASPAGRNLAIQPFDLIYSDSDYFCDVIPAAYLKRKFKAKWVAMVHHKISLDKTNLGTFVTSLGNITLQLLSFIIIKSLADAVFVYESPMGKKIKPIFNDQKRVFFVKNGIDNTFIEKVEPAKGRYDACMIGGLRPSKGMYDIIPIWKEVVKELPQATLVVVGGGLKTYEAWFRAKIAINNMGHNIFFKGALSNKESLMLLKTSEVFFFPSHEEGWGIAILEALSCRKPVVAYDLAVYRGIFSKTITTVKSGDKDSFGKETIRILREKEVKRDANKIKEGTILAKRYDWKNIAAEEEQYFLAILT